MIELNDKNFDQFINSNRLVLIKFGNEFCHSCHKMDESLIKLEDKIINNAISFGTVDYDGNPKLLKRFDTEAIPLLVLFKHGKEITREEGAKSPNQIKEFVMSAIRNK